jgi:hypothetical protein
LTQKGAEGKEDLYEVSYRSANATADDFAKQMLVLLGTLMTAVTSFYLGAGTATSAAKAGAAGTDKSASAPTVSNIDPTSYPVASGSPMKLQLTGSNLNTVAGVKIAKAGVELNGTIVSQTATSLSCNIDVSTATTGTWDVLVDDGKQGTVTIT